MSTNALSRRVLLKAAASAAVLASTGVGAAGCDGRPGSAALDPKGKFLNAHRRHCLAEP